ncbi:MAG: hypothetical protein WCE62_19920, partial [Polyangiales bacterium]
MARTANGTLASLTSWIDLSGGWPEVLWGLVILSLSFSLYGPGRPQPGDFLMLGLLCIPIFVVRFQMPSSIRHAVFSLAVFSVYVFTCN